MHFTEAKGILSAQNGMNIYRGCLHGCIYCDGRSVCYNFQHPFEDIEVKQNAPELLEKALRSKRQKCMIGTGAMGDPYIPYEETLRLTRRCLEVIDRYGFGIAIQTKSTRILQDLPLLKSINEKAKSVVQMTLTTHDEALCRVLEPNVSTTKERVEALKIFRDNGIKTVVWLDPILPFINDNEENIRGILQDCIDAEVTGIICFNMGVTLREGDREYFYAALDRHFPGIKQQYIKNFGNAYEINSFQNDRLMKIFHETCEQHKIIHRYEECFHYLHTFPEKYEQLSLF